MAKSRFPMEAISNPKFVHAVRELKKHRLWFELPSLYQIKIGKFNYFWTTGKITVDGSGKITQRDIHSFIELVRLNAEHVVVAPIQDQYAAAIKTDSISAAAILDLTEIGSCYNSKENPTTMPPWE